MTRFSALILTLGFLGLGGCGPITPAPDYTIKIAPTADNRGSVAVPPNCPNWADNDLNFSDNQPLPQFGCATARNLADMVDRPEDLMQGRNAGPASGITTDGAIIRYNNNQTRGFIYPSATLDTAVEFDNRANGVFGHVG